VSNNYIGDTAAYTGLSIGQFSANGSHLTSATVSGNMIVRSGGNAYDQGQPALRIGIDAPSQVTSDVANATVTGNTIVSSMYDAVGVSSSNATKLTNNTVTSPWRNGIVISPNLPAPTGSATITGNTVTGLKSWAYLDNSTGFSATVSNNSWQ
jgi:parallel beta-helix repeat protein